MSYKTTLKNLPGLLKAVAPKFVIINCFDQNKRKEIATLVGKSIYATVRNVPIEEIATDGDNATVCAGEYADAEALYEKLEEFDHWLYIFAFLQPVYKKKQPYKDHVEEFDGRMLTIIID